MSQALVASLAEARSIDRPPRLELQSTASLEAFASQSDRWLIAASLGYADECLTSLNGLAIKEYGTEWAKLSNGTGQLTILSLGFELLYAARAFEQVVLTAEGLRLPSNPSELERFHIALALLTAARASGVARGYDHSRSWLQQAMLLYESKPLPRKLEALRALVEAQLSYFRDGNVANALNEIDIAVALLRSGDRPANLSFALRVRGMIQKAMGHVHAAQDSYTEATQVAIRSRNAYQISMSLQHLSIAKYRLGEIPRATLLARLAIRSLPKNAKSQDRLQCELTLVRCLLFHERYEQALQRLDRLVPIESSASQRLRAIAKEYRAMAEMGLGRLEHALSILDEADKVLFDAKIGSYENLEMQLRRCEAWNLLGKHREVRRHCDITLERLGREGEQLERGHLLRQRAIACYFSGRPDDALRDLNSAERELRRVADRYELTKMLLDRAELFAQDTRRAMRDAEEAISLATQTGVPALEARAREISELVSVRHRRIGTVADALVSEQPGIVAKSLAMRELLTRAVAFGSHELPVLITGETGAGKEVIAKVVHASSPRAQNRLVCVNCAAIPEQIIERELFGHVRGAFTGADRDAQGLVDVADGGSLFLDEIGELSSSLQAKLLRLLQDGSYRPVGSATERKANLRVIAATHRDLRAMIARNEFREDLYYRIAGLRLQVPALRERPEDIVALAQRFMEEASAELGVDFWMEKGAWTLLREFNWPGNVRQLQMVVRALCVHALPSGVVRRSHVLEQLGDDLPEVVAARKQAPLHWQRELEAFERRLILRALQEAQFCRTSAAKLLGLGRNTFYEKLKRLGIEPQEPGPPPSDARRKAKRGRA